MSTRTGWAHKVPAVTDTAPVKIQDAASAILLDSDELCGRRLPLIVGQSAALRSVLSLVRVVAPTDATVLINGETGTGKELIAEAIHKCSDRSNGPFVKVNCAAIPSGLLESELFGHERGAFTGAVTRNIGRFERANRGTLFLDEIGDLALELQPKLLRVVQEKQFERLGGAATIHTDVRVICATHRNLVEMVNEGQFRADLFYRISVFPIELPALRDRPDDLRLLVHHFAIDYAARMHKQITDISEEFMEVLARHSWPGNVRELQNLIERSVILSTGAVLSGPPELNHIIQDGSKSSKVSMPVTLDEAESSHILQALQQTEGVIGGRNGAAAKLGLKRTTLIHKMKRLGINSGRSAALPARAATPALISEDSIPQVTPLRGDFRNPISSINPDTGSYTGRVRTLAETEKEHISDVVEMTNGLIAGKGGAAKALGLHPSTLRNRVKKLGKSRGR